MPIAKPMLLLPPRKTPAPEFSYWVPSAVSISPATVSVARPPLRLATLEPSILSVPLDARASVLERGFALSPVVVDPGASILAPAERMFIASSQGGAVIITTDMLAMFAKAALHVALAEAEAVSIRPDLRGVVSKSLARLRVYSASASPDLRTAAMIARRILLTAEALYLHQVTGADAFETAIVREEVSRIENATQTSITLLSPVLGTPVNYRVFANLPKGEARSLAFLSLVSLPLLGNTEDSRSTVSVGFARDSFRAALLLARAVDEELDSASATALGRVERLSHFVFGVSDEPALSDLRMMAQKLGFDFRDSKIVSDITRVDRLRHALAASKPPRLADLGALSLQKNLPPALLPALRILGSAANDDTLVLGATVAPATTHMLPSGVDVVRVLSEGALRPTAEDDYDEAVSKLRMARLAESDDARHASVYSSFLDAIGSMGGPSMADAASLLSVSGDWERKRAQSVASSWAMLRSEARLVGRSPMGLTPAPLPEIVAPESFGRVYVEPNPEAILKLTLTLGQLARGLSAIKALSPQGTAARVIAEVDAIVRACLAIAVSETEDREFSQGKAERELLQKMAWLERSLAVSGAFAPPGYTPVHENVATQQTLLVTIAKPQELFVAVRAPGTNLIEVARGIVMPYVEQVRGPKLDSPVISPPPLPWQDLNAPVR
jgi:Protein of unknown function (DUF3160)